MSEAPQNVKTQKAPMNPFVPGFGTSPPVLAGRSDVLAEITTGLAVPGSREHASLIVGPRGSGKTVALNEIEKVMRDRGWEVIALTVGAKKAFLADLQTRCRRLLPSLVPEEPKRRVTGVQIPFTGGGVSWEPVSADSPEMDLRDLLTAIGSLLRERGCGLLITIDELHNASLAEVQDLGIALQHVTMREKNPVAFLGAALPALEESIQESLAATFLQRCAWHTLDPIPLDEVTAALRATIENAGGLVTSQALAYAAESTSGYAFMIQLTGYHMWDAGDGSVRLDDARSGVAAANHEMGRQVLLPQWTGASNEDRRFLVAMTLDDGPSRVADITQRIGKASNHTNVYRARLISAGWIAPDGHGRVSFVHAAARSWIREQRSYDEIRDTITPMSAM